jgi:uncharacterized OB-fold protein
MPETGTPARTIEVLRCGACGVLDPGPREFCVACASPDLRPVRVAGRGSLVSSTVIRRPAAAFRGEGAFEVAVVDLDAGVRVTARLAPGAAIETGERVAIVGERDGVAYFDREKP